MPWPGEESRLIKNFRIHLDACLVFRVFVDRHYVELKVRDIVARASAFGKLGEMDKLQWNQQLRSCLRLKF
ncbi:hypothetical protein BH18ACI4_BH18ACI4_24720 [soil metagenome]